MLIKVPFTTVILTTVILTEVAEFVIRVATTLHVKNR